jgi:hypothetical protein
MDKFLCREGKEQKDRALVYVGKSLSQVDTKTVEGVRWVSIRGRRRNKKKNGVISTKAGERNICQVVNLTPLQMLKNWATRSIVS